MESPRHFLSWSASSLHRNRNQGVTSTNVDNIGKSRFALAQNILQTGSDNVQLLINGRIFNTPSENPVTPFTDGMKHLPNRSRNILLVQNNIDGPLNPLD